MLSFERVSLFTVVVLVSTSIICCNAAEKQGRMKRTLEDVYALVEQDPMWPVLLCEMCVETIKCQRDYCNMCHACSNPNAAAAVSSILEAEMLPVDDTVAIVNSHHRQQEEEEEAFENETERCKYCFNNGCKNTKVCHGCPICNQL